MHCSTSDFLKFCRTDPSRAVQIVQHIPSSMCFSFLSSSDFRRRTPISVAAEHGHHQLVDVLLTAGSNVNSSSQDEATPLFKASTAGHLQVVEILLAARANRDTPNKAGETPLWAAARKGHHQIVEILLTAGANVGTPNKAGLSPLWAASISGHHQVVEILVAAGASFNLHQQLWLAARDGSFRTIQSLIEAGADQNFRIQTSHMDLSMLTFDNLFNRHPETKTALYVASENGHHRVVAKLIAAGVDLQKSNSGLMYPISIASQNGHHRVVEMLLSAGQDKDVRSGNSGSPICLAVMNGHFRVVEVLIAAGADYNHSAIPTDFTPFLPHETSESTGRHRGSSTPIFFAAQSGHSEIVAILLAAGADPNSRITYSSSDVGTFSPLIAASRFGHAQVVELLLAAGADPNDSICNVTSLWAAALGGHHQIVEMLLAAGADRNIPIVFQSRTSSSGSQTRVEMKPLDTALNSRHSKVAALLLSPNTIRGFQSEYTSYFSEVRQQPSRNKISFDDWQKRRAAIVAQRRAPFAAILEKFGVSTLSEDALFRDLIGLDIETLHYLTLEDLVASLKNNTPPLPPLKIRQLFEELKELPVENGIQLKKVYPNGTIYEGEFSLNQPHGKGVETFQGSTYVGFWCRGKKHGAGEFFLMNSATPIVCLYEHGVLLFSHLKQEDGTIDVRIPPIIKNSPFPTSSLTEIVTYLGSSWKVQDQYNAAQQAFQQLEQHASQQQELIIQQRAQVVEMAEENARKIYGMTNQLENYRQEFSKAMALAQDRLSEVSQAFKKELALQKKNQKQLVKFQKQADMDASTIVSLRNIVADLEVRVNTLLNESKQFQDRCQQLTSLESDLEQKSIKLELEHEKVVDLSCQVEALELQLQRIPSLHQEIQSTRERVRDLEATEKHLLQDNLTRQDQLTELGKKLSLFQGEISFETIHSIEIAEVMLNTLHQVAESLPVSVDRVRKHLEVLKRQCSICFDQAKSIVFNCGHHCACDVCADQVSICPICRAPITSRIKLFQS